MRFVFISQTISVLFATYIRIIHPLNQVVLQTIEELSPIAFSSPYLQENTVNEGV